MCERLHGDTRLPTLVRDCQAAGQRNGGEGGVVDESGQKTGRKRKGERQRERKGERKKGREGGGRRRGGGKRREGGEGKGKRKNITMVGGGRTGGGRGGRGGGGGSVRCEGYRGGCVCRGEGRVPNHKGQRRADSRSTSIESHGDTAPYARCAHRTWNTHTHMYMDTHTHTPCHHPTPPYLLLRVPALYSFHFMTEVHNTIVLFGC